MIDFSRGRYRARTAADASEVVRAQRLRQLCFRGTEGRDADDFDPLCRHVLVEGADGALVACFRLMALSGQGIGRSYSAGVYDLGRLGGFREPMLELGRFCVAPGVRDPDVLRVAWGALTAVVDREGVQMLFGCASFPGTDPAPFADVFGLLAERHLGPRRWRPVARSAEVVTFADGRYPEWDAARAMRAMPPLLRSYLGMGGWVGDHAVIDRDLGTLHVFTAVETGRIPPARKRLLRAVAG